MASFSTLFAKAGLGKVVILDGGMGTTLQVRLTRFDEVALARAGR